MSNTMKNKFGQILQELYFRGLGVAVCYLTLAERR